MSQQILKEKLARYLELINPKETQVLCKDLRNIGLCYGLAVCHSTMLLIGKLNWWEAALIQIANWDGTLKSLNKKAYLPDAENPDETLSFIFERILNYIVYNHANVNSTWEHIKIGNSQQATFLLPDNNYFEVIFPDKKIKHIHDRKCAAGFFSTEQIGALLDKQMLSHSICLIHNTYHTISIGYREPDWILYDPNYPHNIQSNHIIHKKFKSKALLANEIQKISGNSLAIEYAFLQGTKTPPFPYWNRLLKTASLNLLNEYGFHLIVMKIPDRIPEIIHFAEKFVRGPEVVAKALVAIDDEQWCALHYLIYFAPQHIPLVFNFVSKSEKCAAMVMPALATVEPEEGDTPWHQLLKYAKKYVPNLLTLLEASPKQIEHFALALLIRSNNDESGWELLNRLAPQYKNRVIKLLLNSVKYISSETLAGLIEELKLPAFYSHKSIFVYENKCKPNKFIQMLSEELSQRKHYICDSAHFTL